MWRELQVIRLRQALAEKGEERDRVLSLFRKGGITEEHVERQMQQIVQEEDTLRGELSELSVRLEGIGTEAAQLAAARSALATLGAGLVEPLRWEARRRLVENLVEGVRVDTRGEAEERAAVITVTYRFSASPAIRQRPVKAQGVTGGIADRVPRLELTISNRTRRRLSRPIVAMRATA